MIRPRATPLQGENGVRERIDSLRALLDDPSPHVWHFVAREYARLGKTALPALRRAMSSDAPRERLRARRLLAEYAKARAIRRLVRFAVQSQLELERGLWLLGRFADPGLDLRPMFAALDAMGAELAQRVEHLPPSRQRCRAVSAYLGTELGYGRGARAQRLPDDALLHRAIVTKRGLPLTLSALYLCVARRAGLEGGLVALPGHVILRLSAADGDLFVDPYRGGVTLEQADILGYLARHGCAYSPRLLECANERDLFARQIRNLQVAYKELRCGREVRLLDSVLGVLISPPKG